MKRIALIGAGGMARVRAAAFAAEAIVRSSQTLQMVEVR